MIIWEPPGILNLIMVYYTGNRNFVATSSYNKQFANLDFENEEYFKTIPSYHDMVRNYFLGGTLDEALDNWAILRVLI